MHQKISTDGEIAAISVQIWQTLQAKIQKHVYIHVTFLFEFNPRTLSL